MPFYRVKWTVSVFEDLSGLPARPGNIDALCVVR